MAFFPFDRIQGVPSRSSATRGPWISGKGQRRSTFSPHFRGVSCDRRQNLHHHISIALHLKSSSWPSLFLFRNPLGIPSLETWASSPPVRWLTWNAWPIPMVRLYLLLGNQKLTPSRPHLQTTPTWQVSHLCIIQCLCQRALWRKEIPEDAQVCPGRE